MFDKHDNYITKLLCFRRPFSLISNRNLKHKIDKLCATCVKVAEMERNTRRFKRGCCCCLRKLIVIIQSSSPSQMRQILELRDIVSCSIKILLFYDDLLYYQTNNNKCEWSLLWKYKLASVCYRNLLQTFAVKSKVLISVVIDCVIQEKLWTIQDLCHDVVLDMLKFNITGVAIAGILCDRLESKYLEAEGIREIVNILCKLLEMYNWPRAKETDVFIKRLLRLYHNCLTNPQKSVISVIAIKKGLETCIRHATEHLTNDTLLTIIQCICYWIINECDLEDALILDYGNILENAASKHQTGLYTRTLTPEVFSLLLRMIGSPRRLVNLLGNHLLQHLLDRKGNKALFDTPRIFFENAPFDITIEECRYEDKLFFKSHRELIHDSIIKSIVNHCFSCLNLETTYCTMCLFAVEIPSGFTAAALVCLAMNMQELTLKENHTRREIAYHIHATIVSLMSLLCWVHRATVFYKYVNKIVLERAQWAPHLNPPLQPRYEHAEHHILWAKPELFFVDWEVRYGLWKRFRLRNDARRISNTIDM